MPSRLDPAASSSIEYPSESPFDQSPPTLAELERLGVLMQEAKTVLTTWAQRTVEAREGTVSC